MENLKYYIPANGKSFTQDELIQLKESYDEAVYTYYQTDSTIMSDLQFDELKDILEANGYELSSEEDVEDVNVRQKLQTANNMISLKKVQVFTSTMEQKHVEGVMNWLRQYNQNISLESEVLVGWKLDGCASELRYKDGELVDIVTRGNFSIAKKMLEVARTQHPTSKTDVIRCEMLMPKTTFIEKHYDENYANPRNLVAGISNDIRVDDQRKWDVRFIKVNDGLNAVSSDSNIFGIEYIRTTIKNLPEVYESFKARRSSLEFPTDGLVVYLPNVTTFEHIGKYPLHCVAIKFPPVEAITKVKEIQWNLKKSGEWIPKAILEPVDLDGSTVKRTLIFNIGFMRKNRVYPGASVVIAKNGDIIPYIQNVVEPGDESRLVLPENTVEIGIHLYPKDNNEIVERERFIAGCYCMGIKNFGYSWFRGLANMCNNNIVRIFNTELVNQSNLEQLFGGRKKPAQYMDALNSLRSQITIYRILRYLQIPKLGPATAKQMARAYSNLDYSTFGLEKAVVEDVLRGNSSYRITQAIEDLKGYGIEVVKEVEDTKVYGATFEMTGSPKAFGFATKDEFCKQVSGWKHTKLDKTTTYLITDDKTSTTGKMGKAAKLGTRVLTYAEAVELYKSQSNE